MLQFNDLLPIFIIFCTILMLNYHIFGKGQPVIVLHGLFGSARNWQSIARLLAEEYQAITVDLRNHGQSQHVTGMTYMDMAKDLEYLIESLELKNPFIIGHSMGGKVAMTFALTSAHSVTGLIIVDIAPVTYEHDFSHYVDAMKSLYLKKIKSRQEAEQVLLKFINSKSLTAFVLQNLVREKDGFQWRINLDEIAKHLPDIVGFPEELSSLNSRIPTLFIGGANSDYIKAKYNQKIFDFFPAAEIKMIEAAGHWVQSDKPEEFLQECKYFIRCLA